MKYLFVLMGLFMICFSYFSYAETISCAIEPCPTHYSCENEECVRFECNDPIVLSDWSAITCSNGKELQQQTIREYLNFPDCIENNIIVYQEIEKPYCLECKDPVPITFRTGTGCTLDGKAIYRQQAKGCAIVNGQKVSTDVELFSYEPNAFCVLPVVGVFFVNPMLSIILFFALIILLLFFLRKKK